MTGENTANPATPNTIVLIHGLWMTSLSWEHWIDRYEARSFQVLTPAWPGMDGDIEELRRDPSFIKHLGIQEIVDHYAAIIRELDRPPIIMGHSFGGAFTQILLDRDLGVAGVAIDSAAVKGVLRLPWSTLKSGFPVLKTPANNNTAVALSLEEFRYQTSPLIARRIRAASLAEMSKPESVRRPRTRRDDGLSRTPRGLRMALNLYPPL
jgi:pimeloyl-ACP methyl ester carboxylesterase